MRFLLCAAVSRANLRGKRYIARFFRQATAPTFTPTAAASADAAPPAPAAIATPGTVAAAAATTATTTETFADTAGAIEGNAKRFPASSGDNRTVTNPKHGSDHIGEKDLFRGAREARIEQERNVRCYALPQMIYLC